MASAALTCNLGFPALSIRSPCCLTPPESLHFSRPAVPRTLTLRRRSAVRTSASAPPPPCQGPAPKHPEASTEATFDINLPRRNLMVQFTCDACGERTQRTINRVAYERGTVFLQCAGCQVYHKLVDNLALMVEYDLREDVGASLDDSDDTK